MLRTVLAVDDEPASLRAVQRALAGICRVLSAGNGSLALEMLATEPIAAMVVDQRMPDMLGTQLLARASVSAPNVVRLLLTGYAEMETLVEAINAGHVYHYLTKPWEPAELCLAVRRGLERYEAELERQRLIMELQQVCARLRREAERKGRLLTLAGHELGTPLHVLLNSLDLMGEYRLPAEAMCWFESACRNAAWLSRIVGQMATAGRWQQRPVTLNRSQTDLQQLLQSVYDRLEHASVAQGRRLQFARNIVVSGEILLDPVWIERAVSNLLSNAIRFTADHGTIEVASRVSGEEVEVAVIDTGIGIDVHQLKEVFEPFSAAVGDVLLHTSGELGFGSRGLGLGLAVARSIAEQHGGTLSVSSAVNRGSRFTLRLPLNA